MKAIVAQHHAVHDVLWSTSLHVLDVHHGKDHHNLDGFMSRIIVFDDADLMKMHVFEVFFIYSKSSASRHVHSIVIGFDLVKRDRVHESFRQKWRHVIRRQNIRHDEKGAFCTSYELLLVKFGVVAALDVGFEESVSKISDSGIE